MNAIVWLTIIISPDIYVIFILFTVLLLCFPISMYNSTELVALVWTKTIDKFTKFTLNITEWNEFNKAKILWITRMALLITS